jgi:hypothetical protein
MMRVVSIAAVLLSFMIPSFAHAQSFPSRPIELVVHSTLRRGPDLIARTVAEIIAREKLLPQPVVVSNKSGGSGAIAQNYVAQKHGDPHTLLAVAATVFLSVPVRVNPELGLDKFHPLALLGVDLADAPDELRALLDGRRGAPLPDRFVGAADRVAQVVVGDRRVLLDGLAGCGVHHRVVAHEFLPLVAMWRKLAPL